MWWVSFACVMCVCRVCVCACIVRVLCVCMCCVCCLCVVSACVLCVYVCVCLCVCVLYLFILVRVKLGWRHYVSSRKRILTLSALKCGAAQFNIFPANEFYLVFKNVARGRVCIWGDYTETHLFVEWVRKGFQMTLLYILRFRLPVKTN